eukprot:8599707-Pyramimonas_sp.AAC.1
MQNQPLPWISGSRFLVAVDGDGLPLAWTPSAEGQSETSGGPAEKQWWASQRPAKNRMGPAPSG